MKLMNKKIIYILLALNVLLLFATGCGKKAEEKHIPLQKKSLHIFRKKTNKLIKQKHVIPPVIVATQNISQVILHGAILDINGEHTISNFYISATPRGLYKKPGSPGHFSGNIALDIDGKFVLSNLVESTYTLKITSDNFHTFEHQYVYLVRKRKLCRFLILCL